MIRYKTFLKLLKNFGYDHEIIAGTVIKIFKKSKEEAAFIPVQLYYSWVRLRILTALNPKVFTCPSKTQIVLWKLFLTTGIVLKSLKMKSIFNRKDVTGYLNAHYLLSFRKGSNDYYYNHLNREYIPLSYKKQHWTISEMYDLFRSKGTTHSPGTEFSRFINHIKTQA